MSFWLTEKSAPLFLANEEENPITLFASFSPFDNNEVSRDIIKRVDERFSEQLSLNSNEYVSQKLDSRQRFLQWYTEWNPAKGALSLRLGGHILKILRDVLGEELEVRGVLSDICDGGMYSVFRTPGNGAATKGMKISVTTTTDQATSRSYYHRDSQMLGLDWLNSGESVEIGICVDDDVKLPLGQIPVEKIGGIHANIRVQVTIASFNSLVFPSMNGTEMMKRINTEILRGGVHADLKIIASNGQAINAHKCFLSVQSPVFAAMFRNECKESLTDQVEIPDMSEEAVTALLAFLYLGDVTAAENSSEIAFDLLEAGHKYEVLTLEDCAKRILLRKPKQWVDVGVALRVFNLKIDGCEDLKAMSVQVMKLKFQELKENDEYKELFRKDPQSAMELCNKIFETSNSN